MQSFYNKTDDDLEYAVKRGQTLPQNAVNLRVLLNRCSKP